MLHQCLKIIGQFLLHECNAQPGTCTAHVCAHRGQISNAGGDIMRLVAILFDTLQNVPQFFLWTEQTLFGPQAMSQNVLQHDEEMLQWQVVAVQLTTETHRLLQQLFDHQFADVHQVTALNRSRIFCCGKKFIVLLIKGWVRWGADVISMCNNKILSRNTFDFDHDSVKPSFTPIFADAN